MAKYLDETGAEQLNQLLAAKFDTKVDKPISKTYTGIQGSGTNNQANYAFYFMSIKPDSYTSTWSVRYRLHVWIPGQSNYDALSDVTFMGDQANLSSYAILNHIYSTSYRPAYYHAMYRLTSAGFSAGYGHAVAMSMADANARDSSGYARSFTVEILDTMGCSVTLLETPVLWTNWPGTGSTNYGSISTYNFSANGLQEVGDNNDTSTMYSYYQRDLVSSNKLFGRNICTLTPDDKLACFTTSYSTGTTKTRNTTDTFRIGAPLFYYNNTTEKAAGSYTGDNTLCENISGVDLRYSTNCGSALTLNKPVYLVGIPNGNNYSLAETWWTQTLPTTEDNKIYIYLGTAYSTTNIGWLWYHPIYEYKNGAIRLYEAPVTSSDVTTALGYTPYSAANPNGYTSNTGTITKVQANGTDVASSGTANIPAATTSKYGVTELSSATNSTSEVLAATPKAVKAAYDLAASKGTGTITGVSVNGTSVATSGVANITSVPASILSGAIPSAVTATTQSASDNSTKIATTAFVQTAIDNLPEPMVFKGSLGTGGTITALPTNGTANIGDTYKVITAGTYASKTAKVGDTFICLTKTSSANTWELIPSGDEPSGTVTSVTIKATSPISIDSSAAITSSGERTLSHANSGVTAGNYKSVTVNATGHVTAGENPTTLAGFGITDAKIASGTITLGSNTITPLTSASTLDANKVSGTLPTSTYTDTKNTAGSTDSSSKLYLIGATSQAANPQTYSDDQVYTQSGTLSAQQLTVGSRKSGTTVGSNSVAEGYGVTASSMYTHAEGTNTTASNNCAHAEGSLTTASGSSSHAEGSETTASNDCSHAEGTNTTASGRVSHAEGWGTIAQRKSQHSGGEYNIADTTGSTTSDRGAYIQIIGNGASATSRSNAHTLDWNGNAWFAGDVYTGSTSGTNKDAGSKKLATEDYVTSQGYVTTDTKNTAGSTDTSSKIYLIGATSQAANPQTYSDNEVYATSGVMTAKSYSLGTYATMEYNSTDNCIEFNFS